MPQLVDEFVVVASTVDIARACRRAAAQFGWKLATEAAGELTFSIPMLTTSWPSKIKVRISRIDTLRTKVALEGKIGRSDPVQMSHLTGQMGRLRTAIELAGTRDASPGATEPEPGSEPGSEPTAESPTDAERAHAIVARETAYLRAEDQIRQRRALLGLEYLIAFRLAWAIVGIVVAVVLVIVINSSVSKVRIPSQQRLNQIYKDIQQGITQPIGTGITTPTFTYVKP